MQGYNLYLYAITPRGIQGRARGNSGKQIDRLHNLITKNGGSILFLHLADVLILPTTTTMFTRALLSPPRVLGLVLPPPLSLPFLRLSPFVSVLFGLLVSALFLPTYLLTYLTPGREGRGEGERSKQLHS